MSNSPIFYKKVQKGYTKGKLLEKSWFFQNFDFFTKNQILPFFYPFYPFFGGGLKVPYLFSIPHKYHVNRSNRKKVMANSNLTHKKRQILYTIVVGKVDCMIYISYFFFFFKLWYYINSLREYRDQKRHR